MVAEAQYVRTKWYQRRWISVGLALCACGFAGAVVVMVIIIVRQPSAASASSLTSPTTAPTMASNRPTIMPVIAPAVPAVTGTIPPVSPAVPSAPITPTAPITLAPGVTLSLPPFLATLPTPAGGFSVCWACGDGYYVRDKSATLIFNGVTVTCRDIEAAGFQRRIPDAFCTDSLTSEVLNTCGCDAVVLSSAPSPSR